MAAIVIRHNPTATWLTGLAGVRAATRDMVQRAMACVVAVIMIGAVGAALLRVAAQLLSFPAPIAVPAIALMAAAPLNSLRQAARSPGTARARHAYLSTGEAGAAAVLAADAAVARVLAGRTRGGPPGACLPAG